MADINDILGRMQDLGSVHVDKTLTLLLYGKPGVGKTVAAVGLAKRITDKNILYIDTREGFVSLENHPKMKASVTRVPYQKFEDFGFIVAAIKTGQLPNIGAVIIDEASTAGDMLLDELHRRALGVGPDVVPETAIDRSLYRPVRDGLVRVITLFQQVHVHLILVAHEKESVDHRGVTITRAGFSPSINDGVQRLLHVASRMTSVVDGAGKVTREVQSHPTYLVDAKSRIGGLPVRTSPTDWVNVIRGWVNDSGAGFVAESKPVDADALPTEGIEIKLPEDDDDQPTMAEL